MYYEVVSDAVSPEYIESCQDYLSKYTPDSLMEWSTDRTVTNEYDDQKFRMVVDSGLEKDKNKAVVVLSEFGTGIIPRLIAKSLVIRECVDPDAMLVIQPSSTVINPNLNFSSFERQILHSGNPRPMIGRLATIMESIGSPENVTIFGPSQGATVGLGYAADPETQPVALSVYDAPNVIDRSFFQLSRDFMSSGSQLKRNVRANLSDSESELAKRLMRDTRALELAKFVIGSIHPDNLAMMGLMRRSTAIDNMADVLYKGGSIAHYYGDQDSVSPFDANDEIRSELGFNPKYIGILLGGFDHSASDVYALNGVLARSAHELMKK